MPPVAPEEPPSLTTSRYRLECAADRPYVSLSGAAGEPIAELFVPCSVHAVDGREDTVTVGRWRRRDLGDHVLLELELGSSRWQRKVCRFRCWEERLAFEVEIEGEGRISAVDYFGGYSSARLRWGSGFFWSRAHFAKGFNPEPTVEESYYFTPTESSLIDTSGVPIAGRGGWFFTPPPFCYAFETEGGWLAMGLEAAPGENRFNEFGYRANRGGFCLSLPFEGTVAVAGSYRLPAIGFDFAVDEYAALERHVVSLRAQRLVKAGACERAEWWSQPIFCGWGAQGYVASKTGGGAPAQARQENYELFLSQLEARGLQPGTVVLDDKWQLTYGENAVDEEKWPDLAGFIADQHRSGRKVLLWLKAWDPEGIPAEECVTNAAGEKVAVDPTNPAFEERFRESIARMLSPEGYDADGFKLDFTARIPCSPGLRLADERVWGLELMRRYLEILHHEAKATKSDALLMTHTPHPYLADVVDMIRLNDINVGADVATSMPHRACIARLACPEAIIDTDNWPVRDKSAWRRYLEIQPELGVSSLYFTSHIDSTGEALDEDDFELIRRTWKQAPARSETVVGVGEQV
ncbi:MAG TPA: hypothetical protein VF168_14330 [Trueperaceae bacterium]